MYTIVKNYRCLQDVFGAQEAQDHDLHKEIWGRLRSRDHGM